MWAVRGDGRRLGERAVVRCDEHPGWVWTAIFGTQHLVVMFGASLLVATLLGFPPMTTLLMSGVGTLLLLVLTKYRVPSVVGASMMFVIPLAAAAESGGATPAILLGGVVVVGVVVLAVGVAVKALGVRMLEAALPPVVTGAIVLMLGLTFAPIAMNAFVEDPVPGLACAVVVLAASVLARGAVAQVSVLLGVCVGWVVAFGWGDAAGLARVRDAAWFAPPEMIVPQVHLSVVPFVLPTVILLVATQVGNVKATAAITDRNLDGHVGDALIGGGLATMVAGCSGAPGMTTYVSNVGAVAATRVHTTAPCVFAGVAAVVLSFSPKVAAVLNAVPAGVLGGASVILFGMVAMVGARIWAEARVDFTDPVNLIMLGAALVAAVGDLTLVVGDVEVAGLVWGSAGIVFGYPVLRRLADSGRVKVGSAGSSR